MQIPPTTALLNLVASLPAQGVAAAGTAPAAAKPTPPIAPSSAGASVQAAGAQTPSGLNPLPRGSLLNIVV